MVLKYYYWYFTNAISRKICDRILKLGLSKKKVKGVIGLEGTKSLLSAPYKERTKKEKKLIDKKRNSSVVWLDETWIYDALHPFIFTANQKAGWNFQWDWTERSQFTEYKKNQFYGWHQDSIAEPSTAPGNYYGKIRKLSSILFLSDSSEYEGGELQFDFKQYSAEEKTQIKDVVEIKDKGSLIVFPSFVWHRLKPITKGVRYSLPSWHWGKPFI